MRFISSQSKTKDNFPFFKDEILCDLWIEELKLAKKYFEGDDPHRRFRVYGFCLSHDHFHILFEPTETADLSKIMHFLKRNFSRDANKIMGLTTEGESSKPEGDIPKCRPCPTAETQICVTEHPGDDWDRRLREHKIFLQNLRQKFLKKHGENHDFPKFAWQKSFHDHFIRNERDFDEHAKYISENLEKHSLPENWRFVDFNFNGIIDF